MRQKRLRGNNPTVLAGRTLQLEADSVNVRHRQQIRYSPHRKVFLVDYPTSVIGIDATRPTGKVPTCETLKSDSVNVRHKQIRRSPHRQNSFNRGRERK